MSHSLAVELNEILQAEAPEFHPLLSSLGKDFYFPKGILTQTAEAKQKAKKFNATIGIAKEKGKPMFLPSVMEPLAGISPEEALAYAPSFGQPDLRKAWKAAILDKNPSLRGKDISLPVVTSGITHGLSVAADLFADPGDTVWAPDQLWGNYNMIFGVRRGARMARYPLFDARGGFDGEGFSKALAGTPPGGKAIVLLNFPNNPTGYSPTEAEADGMAATLVALAESGRRVLALCDDAYFGLAFEPGVARESLFARLVGAHPRLAALKLDGATKEDYVWGFRVGFLTFGGTLGPKALEALERKAAGAVRGAVSNVSQLSQSVVLKAMQKPSYAGEKKQKYEVMKARYEKSKAVLAKPEFSDVWTPYPYNSGYFLCLRLKGLNAETYRLRLLDVHGVGVIATAPTDVRVAYSCLEVEEIEPMFNLMRQCALEMKGDPQAADLTLHAQAFEE
jgi:aspartate/methionine/tyrosine aminotransferase